MTIGEGASCYVGVPSAPLRTSSSPTHKGYPHVSHLRRWKIDAPRTQRLRAGLTSAAPTALVAGGMTDRGMAICGCLIERGADQCCRDPSTASRKERGSPVGMTEKRRDRGGSAKREERFLSAQADRLAGARREEKSRLASFGMTMEVVVSRYVGAPSAPLGTSSAATHKGHRHISHLRCWKIDTPRTQRLRAGLTSAAPTALAISGGKLLTGDRKRK